MQSNFSYLASAPISQFDLLTIDTSSTSDLALYAKPAGAGDSILGRANSAVPVGEPVNFSDLTIGKMITCIAGGSISAGDHLSCAEGKVVKGTASLVACEAASSGDKLRVVVVAELNDGVDKAKSLDLSAAVGSESQGVYFKADGKPYPTTGGGFDVSSLFATDENGVPAVGSIGLYELFIQGATNHYYGEEVTMTRASASAAKVNGGTGATCCSPLHINIGELSDKVTWSAQSGRKSLPVDAKIRILTSMDANSGLVLAIRTA